MNYLSSSNYFHIKNPFSILFIQFKRVLDWASIIRKVRGLGARIPRHSVQYPQDGGLIQRNPRGSLTKWPAKGYRRSRAVRLETDAPDQILSIMKRYAMTSLGSETDDPDFTRSRTTVGRRSTIRRSWPNAAKGYATSNLSRRWWI